MNEKLVLGMTAVVIILTACESLSNKMAGRSSHNIGMANPASQYCISQGGQLKIEKTKDGEQGICTLKNGEVIEEWELFHRDHPK